MKDLHECGAKRDVVHSKHISDDNRTTEGFEMPFIEPLDGTTVKMRDQPSFPTLSVSVRVI